PFPLGVSGANSRYFRSIRSAIPRFTALVIASFLLALHYAGATDDIHLIQSILFHADTASVNVIKVSQHNALKESTHHSGIYPPWMIRHWPAHKGSPPPKLHIVKHIWIAFVSWPAPHRPYGSPSPGPRPVSIEG